VRTLLQHWKLKVIIIGCDIFYLCHVTKTSMTICSEPFVWVCNLKWKEKQDKSTLFGLNSQILEKSQIFITSSSFGCIPKRFQVCESKIKIYCECNKNTIFQLIMFTFCWYDMKTETRPWPGNHTPRMVVQTDRR